MAFVHEVFGNWLGNVVASQLRYLTSNNTSINRALRGFNPDTELLPFVLRFDCVGGSKEREASLNFSLHLHNFFELDHYRSCIN